MMPALKNAERLQVVQRRELERFTVKVRMHEADVVRQALNRLQIK